CASNAALTVHVRIDERSAGFFAIGRALATGRPVAVVVTSGSAAAELHAAVAEADLANVALLVVTADRPPELHGVGAPQTIEQRELYGTKVRRYEEPGVARLEASASWRPLANRLWSSASGVTGRAGPTHLNAAFSEPLLGVALDLPAARANGAAWRTSSGPQIDTAGFEIAGQRVLAVVGQGVDHGVVAECVGLNWVVLGDATAQGTTAYFDPLLRSEEFAQEARPDLVIRLGCLPASKVLASRLREWNVRTVALLGAGEVADPDGLISEQFTGLPQRDVLELRADEEYALMWSRASASVGESLERGAKADDALTEPMVARTVVEASADHGVPLVIGSSMPFRDVEWWAPMRQCATYANRGTNGIDGVVSTVLGVCAGGRGLGLVGDLTMLHDVSGLVDGLGEAGGTCVLVVADNRGGGIFSFLPQASALEPERFEQLFGTPRRHDLVAVASAFGHGALNVTTRHELRHAIERGLSTKGLSVIVASVPDRDENVRLHDAMNQLIIEEHQRTS
ncbi:MAG: 2-succinyl-5-enolpyruvyl-6-hydroxy-3-cyclohexene-1-carboxylic-acid synthase, partial [Acidobacteria bacterium]|nr:2-succinyl-5-enolpyruvyl-6-hydroxy-3-cyclohexene-1-carboxylic-acid synthase [Acidobacteriota bacterium]